MSIEALTWALSTDPGSATRKLVLLSIANYAHKDGRNAWPSQETIARDATCDERTVRRHLKVLTAEGWLREGDQQQVAHLRADRRPVVYDVAMRETTRQEWAAQRADRMSARSDERGDIPPGRGPINEGTSCPPRGDTAVSAEPLTNQDPPVPPQAVGTSPSPHPKLTCARPGPRPHVNCRGCGTTARQIADQQAHDATERRRLDAQAAAAEAREEAQARRAAPDSPARVEARHRIRRILKGTPS